MTGSAKHFHAAKILTAGQTNGSALHTAMQAMFTSNTGHGTAKMQELPRPTATTLKQHSLKKLAHTDAQEGYALAAAAEQAFQLTFSFLH